MAKTIVNGASLRRALGQGAQAPVGVGKTSSLRAAALGGQGYSTATNSATTSSGSPSPWSYIKQGGARALDALTVPQAALFTTVAKASGKDIDWGTALGNFGRNAEGESGQEQALKALGVSNKWARLGLEVVVDPTWFLAPAAIAGKLGKAATIAEDVAGAVNDARAVASTVGDARKAAMIRAFAPKARRASRPAVAQVSDARKAAMIRAFTGKGRTAPQGVSDVRKAAMLRAFKPAEVAIPEQRASALQNAIRVLNAAADLNVGKPMEYVLRRGKLRSTRRGVQYGHKVAVPFKPVPEGGRRWAVVARKSAKDGRVAADELVGAPKAAEAVFSSKDEALRYLAQAAREARLARPKGPTPAALREAMGDVVPAARLTAQQKAAFARAFAGGKKGRILTAGKTVDKVPYKPNAKTVKKFATYFGKHAKKPPAPKADPNLKPWAINENHLFENFPEGARALKEAAVAEYSRAPGSKLGVRIGAGKWSKTISTGVPLRAKKLRPNKLKGGFVRLKPIEKVAHRLRNMAAESADGVAAGVLNLYRKYGLTTTNEAGQEIVKQSESTMIGIYRAARSENRTAGETVENFFREIGWWEPRHNQLIQEMDKRFKHLEQDLPDKVADHFVKKISEVQEKQAALDKKLQKLDSRIDAGEDTRTMANKRTKLLEEMADHDREIARLRERGEYTPYGKSQQQVAKDREKYRQDVKLGLKRPGGEYSAKGDVDLIDTREVLDNPFLITDPDEFVDDLMKLGLSEDHALSLQVQLDNVFEAKGLPKMGAKKIGTIPEWQSHILYERREDAHIWIQVERQIEDLLAANGIGKDSHLYKSIQRTARADAIGRLGGTEAGRWAMRFVTGLKGVFTFVNPAHFTTNFLGDFSNRQINGGFRHLNPTDAAPRSKFWRTANADVRKGYIDHDALNIKYNIPGQGEMTGAELLAMSRMMGLGRGYVGTDVAVMVDAFEKAGHGPKEWYRWAQRMNIKRENAQRLGTWVRHMQSGDDPYTAMFKTIRVHFDYTELTDFERLALRNVLLFYTWLKKNTVLQNTGLVTRPGLFSAYADFEEHREKWPNEPGYLSQTGIIPTPLGGVQFAAPWSDLKHDTLDWDNFRQTILGSVNPIIRVPTEIAVNQSMFTGSRIQDYDGQITPGPIASLLSGLGVPLNLTSTKAGGGKAPGLNPQLSYALSQITGPQLNTAGMVLSTDTEGSRSKQAIERILGVKIPEEQPVKWKRSADYIARKRKADETRRRGAQEVR